MPVCAPDVKLVKVASSLFSPDSTLGPTTLPRARARSRGLLAAPARAALSYPSSTRCRSAARASARSADRRSACSVSSGDAHAHELAGAPSTRSGVLERRSAPGGFTLMWGELTAPAAPRRARVLDRQSRSCAPAQSVPLGTTSWQAWRTSRTPIRMAPALRGEGMRPPPACGTGTAHETDEMMPISAPHA